MSGTKFHWTVERKKTPPVDQGHVCPKPSYLQRFIHRLRVGAIIRCDCGRAYQLVIKYWGAGESTKEWEGITDR